MGTQPSVRGKVVLGAALGAGVGVLLGAAGACLYHYLSKKNEKLNSIQESLSRLELALYELRHELAELREPRKRITSGSSNWTQYESACDMLSTVNSDDDIFYDAVPEENTLTKRPVKSKLHNLFDKVDALMEGNDNDRIIAYEMLMKHEFEFSEDPNLLWRLAKACTLQASLCDAKNAIDEKKKFINEGLEYASKALAMDSENGDVNKWFAALKGLQGNYLSLKEKINSAWVFYKHVTKAIELKPEDPSLYHMLGRFKYEVANVSWMERKLASSLIADLPNVTFSNAIEDFLEAERLVEGLKKTPWKENKLLLAKCYIGEKMYPKAVVWLESGLEVPAKTKEDEVFDKEMKCLLSKYGGK